MGDGRYEKENAGLTGMGKLLMPPATSVPDSITDRRIASEGGEAYQRRMPAQRRRGEGVACARIRVAWQVAALGTLFVAREGAALEPQGHEPSRTLANHRFIKPVNDDGAFLTPSIGFRQGLTYIGAGTLMLGDTPAQVTFVNAVESLDLNVRVVEWFGVSFRADLDARVAASDIAALTQVGRYSARFRIGPAFRLLRIEETGTQVTFRASGSLGFGAAGDIRNVLAALEARENAPADPDAPPEQTDGLQDLEESAIKSSVSPISLGAWRGSLHVAQTLTPFIGLQASYALTREHAIHKTYNPYARTTSSSSTTSFIHQVAATIGIDGASAHVPLGIMAETLVTAGTAEFDPGPAVEPDTTVLVGIGLNYTGDATLQAGVFAGVEYGMAPIETSFGTTAAPKVYYGQFTLRHFF